MIDNWWQMSTYAAFFAGLEAEKEWKEESWGKKKTRVIERFNAVNVHFKLTPECFGFKSRKKKRLMQTVHADIQPVVHQEAALVDTDHFNTDQIFFYQIQP